MRRSWGKKESFLLTFSLHVGNHDCHLPLWLSRKQGASQANTLSHTCLSPPSPRHSKCFPFLPLLSHRLALSSLLYLAFSLLKDKSRQLLQPFPNSEPSRSTAHIQCVLQASSVCVNLIPTNHQGNPSDIRITPSFHPSWVCCPSTSKMF